MDRLSSFSSFPEPHGLSKKRIEPFLDESLVPKEKTPFIHGLQLSAESLSKEEFLQFIENVKPVLEHLSKYSRRDQQFIRDHLHLFNQQLQKSELSLKAKECAQEFFAAYNQFLVQSTPFQQGQMLFYLERFERTLS